MLRICRAFGTWQATCVMVRPDMKCIARSSQKPGCRLWLCGLNCLVAAAALADDSSDKYADGKPSPIQSKARPFDLDIVGPVMRAGSDATAANFQNNALPGITALVNATLQEGQALSDSASLLDPSKLNLKTAADVRVYFVGEGANYANTLGFNTTGTGVTSGDPQLIFPNASSSASLADGTSGRRTSKLPLLPGDFVNLGQMGAGTQLDFFLIADGANGGTKVYSTESSANPDGLNHAVAFAYAVPDSPYLLMGFEDLYGGGDQDFNDIVFAVDIGAANIAQLTGTPEPALFLTLGTFGAGLWWIKRRRDGAGPTVALAGV